MENKLRNLLIELHKINSQEALPQNCDLIGRIVSCLDSTGAGTVYYAYDMISDLLDEFTIIHLPQTRHGCLIVRDPNGVVRELQQGILFPTKEEALTDHLEWLENNLYAAEEEGADAEAAIADCAARLEYAKEDVKKYTREKEEIAERIARLRG